MCSSPQLLVTSVIGRIVDRHAEFEPIVRRAADVADSTPSVRETGNSNRVLLAHALTFPDRAVRLLGYMRGEIDLFVLSHRSPSLDLTVRTHPAGDRLISENLTAIMNTHDERRINEIWKPMRAFSLAAIDNLPPARRIVNYSHERQR